MPAPDGKLSAAPVALLTIEHAGRTWRLSSRPCDIVDGSTSYHYRGGLAGSDIYVEAPICEPAQPATLPLDCIVGGDLALLASQGHLLDEMRAEVALYREGDAWGKRKRVIEGPCTVESGGYDGRPLRVQVTADDPVGNAATWPPPDAQISDDTWTTAANPLRSHSDTEEGATYPQVVGRAGLIRIGGTWAGVAATPVYPVVLDDLGGWDGLHQFTPWGDITTWTAGAPPQGNFGLVSQGWMYPGPPGASKGQIQITKDTGARPLTWKTAWMYYATDGLGRTVTLARLQNGVSAWGNIVSDGSRYYAHIPQPCSGIARRDWLDGIEGAGEIIQWALESAGKRVDWRRTVPALATLDRFRLGGFWDQGADPWEWAASNILQILPATWIPGLDGLYPVVWRLDADVETADIQLTDGLNCTIEGEPKQEHQGDILSRATLEYGNAVIDGKWRRRLVYHGDQQRETIRSVPTIHARLAQQRWGSRRGGTIQALEQALSSDLIYRDETADRWLAWLIRLYSAPWTVIRVVGNHRSPLAHAEPGMVASITSSRYSLSRRVAHVRRAGWLGGMCYADLVMISNP